MVSLGKQRTTDVLILVKAYPNLSRRYGEVACIAGIDLEAHRLIRLYPVPFRELAQDKQFSKYQTIRVELRVPSTDRRKESWRVDPDSLAILGPPLDTKKGWRARRSRVEGLIGGTMCETRAEVKTGGATLKLIRPAKVADLIIESVGVDSEKSEMATQSVAQSSLLTIASEAALERKALEAIPYRFKYKYFCEFEGCKGHRQSIVDWEICALFRAVKGDKNWKQLIRDKWLNEMCRSDKDTAFIVGNHSQYPQDFMVLGVWWPPKIAQMSLGDLDDL